MKVIIGIILLMVTVCLVSDFSGVAIPGGRIDRWQKATIDIYNNPPPKPELFNLPVPYIVCLDNGQSDGCIDYKNCVFEGKTDDAMTVRCFGSGTVAGYKVIDDIGRGFVVHGFPNPSYIERIW